MTERFFIPTPVPAHRRGKDSVGNEHDVYLDGITGLPMLWSGKFPPPAVGQRIFITMNGIGWAVVKGYFESAGFLGVMTLATRPPQWLRAQRRRDLKSGRTQPAWVLEGIGCEFGTEIALKRPVKAKEAIHAQA